MFSTKITRAAHRAITTTPSPTPSALSSAATCTAIHRSAPRPSHQRRASSSKASCPPDSSKPAPAAKGAGAAVTATSADESPAPAAPAQKNVRKWRKGGGGDGARTSKLAEVSVSERQGQTDHFAGLPAVPGVQHLGEKEFGISSFFALHRPVSVTTTIPPPASIEAFNNIFDTRSTRDPWADGDSAQRRPEDVIYTLHNTIESLENNATASQDEGVRWEVIQESPTNNTDNNGVKHLDGVPAPKLKSLEELVAQFTPFRAPPPPSPFPTQQQQQQQKGKKRAATTVSLQKRLASAAQAAAAATGQKSYQTTITILETTAPNGEQSYSASHTPIVQVDGSGRQTSSRKDMAGDSQARRGISYMERRRAYLLTHRPTSLPSSSSSSSRIASTSAGSRARAIRQALVVGRRNVRMYAISVKRQRKLKMKKHKYKKLMKRTRNLRRRLDRN